MARQKKYKSIAEYKHDWYVKNKDRILKEHLDADAIERERRKRKVKCSICNHFFYTSKENQKYCSNSCSKQGDILRSKKFGDLHKPNKKEYDKFYRLAHIEKLRERGWKGHLRRKFGITIEDYNTMLEAQDNRCAICKKHQSEFKKALYVDHDHETGKVRGLLCGNCNSMLGYAIDNIENLESAIVYLQKE